MMSSAYRTIIILICGSHNRDAPMKTYAPGRSIFAGILLLGPLLVFVALRLIPSLDSTFANSIFHFYIVSFTSLIAFVVAVFHAAAGLAQRRRRFLSQAGVAPIFCSL